MQTEEQNPNVVIPPIEENIPLPKNAIEALPELSNEEELEMRANTIKLISDITGQNIEPNEKNKQDARKLANEMINNPENRLEFGNYPNETMAYLAGLVAQTDCALVKKLADYKTFIVNNLVQIAATAKLEKDRINALSKLGDIDGVDAFRRTTEVIHTTKSGKELEEELKKAIEELKGKVVEGEVLSIEEDNND